MINKLRLVEIFESLQNQTLSNPQISWISEGI